MARILIVGDIMLDHYIMGDATRISPEAPVPVVGVKHEELRLGGAANVAANIAAMGGDATLLFLTGHDTSTQQLLNLLSRYSLKIHVVDDLNASTTKKTRVLASQQQIIRIDSDFHLNPDQQQKILKAFSDIVSQFDFIVFSDYSKGTLDRLPEFLSITKKRQKFTLVDPKRSDPQFYRGASVLKPNRREFAALFGEAASIIDISKRAEKAIAKFDIGAMVVTLGQQGMLVIESNKPPIEMPTKARDVFDVSGAGDTVMASLACELSAGKSLSFASMKSNIAASIAVAHLGTHIVTLDELEKEVANERFLSKRIITSNELKGLIAQLRAANKKIVFTNGCFDILHTGHVRLFNEARTLGDVLIVGLNSDTSIKVLKGDRRPINSFSSRAEVVLGLEAVNFVIEFDSPTPIDLITEILPDVLVKGGDYKIDDIVGYDVVKANGGEVRSLTYHAGYSTSRIVNDFTS